MAVSTPIRNLPSSSKGRRYPIFPVKTTIVLRADTWLSCKSFRSL
jgi:hypothetical protein